MKKIICCLLLTCVSQTGFSQTDSVEKSIFNVQTGILGIWANNEYRLAPTVALKTEIGFDAGLWVSSNNNGFLMTPGITLEPRWYYNIKSRASKGRNTENNGANFLALMLSYNPDWFVVSSQDNIYVKNQIAVIPTWSIRRNFGQSNFNYEAGLGLGYKYFFMNDKSYEDDYGEVAVNLNLRIGYTFLKSKK